MRGVKFQSVYPIPVITPRGMALLSLAVLAPIAGFAFDLPLVVTIAVILMTFLSVAAQIYRERRLAREALEEGEFALELPKLLYSGVADKIICRLRFTPDSELELVRVRVPHPVGIVAPQQQTSFRGSGLTHVMSITLPITPTKRGPVEWKEAHLRLSAGLGLAEWEYALALDQVQAINCYPAIASSISAWNKTLVKQQTGPRLSLNGFCYGKEFDSLRPYVLGDDPRTIDWKRSARGFGLLVRKYRPETHQRVIVAIDCSRKMGCRIGNRSQIEYAADAAATLVHSAHLAGDECGLFAFSHQLLSQIPPERGSRQVNLIMERLCALEIGQLEPDYQLLADWTHMSPRRSLLVLITTATNPASIDGLRLSLAPLTRKHLPLVCAIRDHELDEMQAQAATDLEAAYVISAAVGETTKIADSLKLLSHSGIMTVHCTAGALAEKLESQYLALKISGRL